VTRAQLPQRAGSLGLNGGGAAAVVPPDPTSLTLSVIVCVMWSDWQRLETTESANQRRRRVETCWLR